MLRILYRLILWFLRPREAAVPDADLTTLDEIDQDLRTACLERQEAWRQLVVKDSTANRDAYTEASERVDGLLEMRHAMATADSIVTA